VAVGHQAAIRLGNKPTVLAMILGSVYLGGAYFFIRAERVPVPVSGRGHRYLAMAADLGDCPNVGRDLCARTGRSGRLAFCVTAAGVVILYLRMELLANR